eukprot:CAMPEP_0177694856 /NCGR_PEP_ID=MMETSP0484_2-20121128/3151_1 /TAXON_ID=354590 /ORGANISM="Rhodomonas lens, Strain RHODO" /LENGTH=357 /DNA_ID=CAMNT_0019205751 /DNA_START=25 /DNA_END=1098 /DNA_ORIENTATION=+
MSDGGKLAEILAKKKAARAARPQTADAGGRPDFSQTMPLPNREEDEEERRLMVSLGGCNVTHPVSDGWHPVPEREMLAETKLSSGVVDIDDNEIEMEGSDKVAQGGLGVLYRAYWRGTEVAVKKPVDPRAGMDPKLKDDFRKEAAILGEVRHPNVVLLMAACLRAPKLCIVLEWCSGGSLFDLLHRSRADPSRDQKLHLAEGVAAGLAFLHASSPAIIHRDIKTQNVLVDVNLTVAKICDFGLAIRTSDVSQVNSAAGTPRYMAPELYRSESCSTMSDVYAYAVTLWEMFSREMPFGGMDIEEVRDKTVRGERPEIPLTCPRQVSLLIRDCWAQSPQDRPPLNSVLMSIRAMREDSP